MPTQRSDSPLGQIGNTPLVRLNHLADKNAATVWGKLEGANPGRSEERRVG